MYIFYPCYLLITSCYLIVTIGYLIVTSGFLIATTAYLWLFPVSSGSSFQYQRLHYSKFYISG